MAQENVKTEAKKNAAQGLRELFVKQLKDIYWVENKLTSILPRMQEDAVSKELLDALREHQKETENHVSKVEQVFSALDMSPEAEECEAMAGIIEEGEEIISETEAGVVRDAGIIAAAQKVEHYEIASYGTLAEFANILKEKKAVSILEEILNEEKQADKKLSQVASSINVEAAEETEEI